MNHESAFSGYLGAKKTEEDRILQNSFWPGLRQDVIRFSHSFVVCQRTVKKGVVKKVLLGSIPLINTPFKIAAVDIVGYILTLADYVTGYPEQFHSRRLLLRL